MPSPPKLPDESPALFIRRERMLQDELEDGAKASAGPQAENAIRTEAMEIKDLR